MGPNGFAREALLPFWHAAGCLAGGLVAWWHTSFGGLVACWLGGLVAGWLGGGLVAFKVPQSAHFDGSGVRKT